MVSSRSPEDSDGGGCSCLLGIALAYKDAQQIQTLPALLCLLFAWVMQIDSNLVNDYFDFKHGNDDETRLGPKRACAEGWITLGAMKWGIILTTFLGCVIGLPLVLFGGWEMVIVGICCVVFCFSILPVSAIWAWATFWYCSSSALYPYAAHTIS